MATRMRTVPSNASMKLQRIVVQKELPAAIESKKRRLEGQLERRDSNQAPDQQQKMPPINESSIDTDELPVRVPTGECQDTAQNVSGQGKEEPGPHDQVKAA